MRVEKYDSPPPPLGVSEKWIQLPKIARNIPVLDPASETWRSLRQIGPRRLILGLLLQGFKSPPPRFWEVPPNIGSQIFRFCRKVRNPPPRRMAQRGGTALRATYSRWGVRYRGELPEKLAKKGCTPVLGTFWRFWGFPVKTVGNPGLPGNPRQQRKWYTDLRGSSQRSSRGSI